MLTKMAARQFLILVLFLCFSVLNPDEYITSIALAQDGEAENVPVEVIEPAADDILREMSDTLTAAKEFTFEAEISFDEVLDTGQVITFGGTIKAAFKRPDKFYGEFIGDRTKKKVWYSGTSITVLDEDKNFYGQLTTPDNMDDTMDFLMENYDFSLPLADILHTDSYGSFTGTVVDGVLIGESNVRGAECVHIAFVGENVDWQLWSAVQEPVLPCKLVITYKKLEGDPQYEAIFSNWNLSPGLNDAVFKPALPEGATKIDFIKMKKDSGVKK